MSQPYVGEIRLFGGNFAPAGWAMCEGQLLAISENSTLFALIGTTYGGDGQNTFGVPDLRGRVPIHQGTGSGLSTRVLGEVSGIERVTLTVNQIPIHTHAPAASSAPGTQPAPTGGVWGTSTLSPYSAAPGPATGMNAAAAGLTGGNQPHENTIPFLAVNFIISLFGIFPSQN